MVDRFVPVARFVRTSRPFAALQRWRLKRWLSGPGRGLPPSVYKQHEVLRNAEAFGLSILVETGTFNGGMVLATYRQFERVYTIELYPRLHQRMARMFRKNEVLLLALAGVIAGNSVLGILQPLPGPMSPPGHAFNTPCHA